MKIFSIPLGSGIKYELLWLCAGGCCEIECPTWPGIELKGLKGWNGAEGQGRCALGASRLRPQHPESPLIG